MVTDQTTAERIRYWIVWGWLCFESGAFVVTNFGWNKTTFWPFWVGGFILLSIGIEAIARIGHSR